MSFSRNVPSDRNPPTIDLTISTNSMLHADMSILLSTLWCQWVSVRFQERAWWIQCRSCCAAEKSESSSLSSSNFQQQLQQQLQPQQNNLLANSTKLEPLPMPHPKLNSIHSSNLFHHSSSSPPQHSNDNLLNSNDSSSHNVIVFKTKTWRMLSK